MFAVTQSVVTFAFAAIFALGAHLVVKKTVEAPAVFRQVPLILITYPQLRIVLRLLTSTMFITNLTSFVELKPLGYPFPKVFS